MAMNASTIISYQNALHRYLFMRVAEREEVKDITQEAFLRFFRADQDQTFENPLGYLLRIGRNLAIDRSRRTRSFVCYSSINEDEYLSEAPAQEDTLHLEDLQRELTLALDGLTPRCRAVFLMRRQDEMSVVEISRDLGISPRMVQKYLIKATTHLHSVLHTFEELR